MNRPARTTAGSVLIALAALALLLMPSTVRGDEPVVTVLADFEDDSVAARVAEVANVPAADCAAEMASIPARGQRSLALEIGATAPNATMTCNLRFRVETRFGQADRVASYCWLREGEIELAFRVRDARGRVFETRGRTVSERYRWVRIVADLDPDHLKPVPAKRGTPPEAADERPVWPLEILGYRASTRRLGRQLVYIDDLEVEHRVPSREMIRGEFRFDEPTKLYRPRTSVGAAVVLENRSRRRAVRVSVRLAWMRPDGSTLKTQHDSKNLPASGPDFRSHQTLDFSQRIDQPGLYQLVARVRAPGWKTDHLLQTTIAVTLDNRNLSRGRSTFFGVHTDLVREPLADQLLEIDLARQIGVHVLAFQAPWSLLEPKHDHYRFEQFDRLIDAIGDRGMAPLLVLTEPPEWLASDHATRLRRLTKLLRACARHYGRRVSLYQPTPEVMGLATPAEQTATLATLQQQLAPVQPDARVLSAPYAIPPSTGKSASLPASAATGPHLTFLTQGDTAAALADLRRFAQPDGFTWQTGHWWLHRAEPFAGDGSLHEAEAILRHYITAAAAGVNGLIWFNLRDNTALVEDLNGLRGLARRDFSPKLPLLGYATTAGVLTGLRYAGALHGTPDDFDAALFIGSDQQVAVLLPKPNRIRPAVVAPIRGVAGKFHVQDFERRRLPVLHSTAPPLVPTREHPFFITLDLDSAQPEPQLALAQPWLNVPTPAFCGTDTSFPLEITAPFPLRSRSFLQLILPTDAPFESSFTARALRIDAGDTQRFQITLTPKTGQPFDRAEVTLRLSLKGKRLSIPLEVRPLTDIQPLASAAQITQASHQIGRLTTTEPDTATAAGVLYAAYEQRRLHLAIAIDDDRLIPPGPSAPGRTPTGDRLLLGLAVENHQRHTELEIRGSSETPELAALHGTSRKQLRGLRCRLEPGTGKKGTVYHLEVPARALELREFTAGTHLLLAVRYLDDDGRGNAPRVFRWGKGLDGSRSTASFRWVRIAGPHQP